MPIYTYACSTCGHKQDHLMKMNDILTVCPNCEKPTYSKQLTAPAGFNLKGGGFYETDFKTPCGISANEAKEAGCSGGCACPSK